MVAEYQLDREQLPDAVDAPVLVLRSRVRATNPRRKTAEGFLLAGLECQGRRLAPCFTKASTTCSSDFQYVVSASVIARGCRIAGAFVVSGVDGTPARRCAAL